MIQQALEYLNEKFSKAAHVRILNVEGEAKHVQHVINGDGSVKKITTEPPLRTVVLDDIGGIVSMCKSINSEGMFFNHMPDGKNSENAVTIYECAICVTGSMVRLYLDINDLREHVTVPLRITDAYEFFHGLKEKQYLIDQESLLDALRYRFHEVIPSPETRNTYIKQLEKVQWQTTITNDVTRTRGADTLGKSINDRILEQSDIGLPPDVLLMKVQRWTNVPVSAQGFDLQVAFGMQPKLQRFILRPLQHAWEVYHQVTVARLAAYISEEIKDTQIPVYIGSLTPAK